MAVGSLGDISFEVSDKQVLTFQDVKYEGKMRYATHEIIGKKPIAELVGPDLHQITFKIYLAVSLGINPAEEMKKIRAKRDSGEALSFVLGEKVIGDNKWVIEGIGEAWPMIDNKGNIFSLAADISLKEYVEKIDISTEAGTNEEVLQEIKDDIAERENYWQNTEANASAMIQGDGDGGENPTLYFLPG